MSTRLGLTDCLFCAVTCVAAEQEEDKTGSADVTGGGEEDCSSNQEEEEERKGKEKGKCAVLFPKCALSLSLA